MYHQWAGVTIICVPNSALNDDVLYIPRESSWFWWLYVLMDLTVAEVGVMVQLTMDGRDTSVPLVRRAVA